MWVLKHTKNGGKKYQLEGLILSHALTRMTAPSTEGAFWRTFLQSLPLKGEMPAIGGRRGSFLAQQRSRRLCQPP